MHGDGIYKRTVLKEEQERETLRVLELRVAYCIVMGKGKCIDSVSKKVVLKKWRDSEDLEEEISVERKK